MVTLLDAIFQVAQPAKHLSFAYAKAFLKCCMTWITSLTKQWVIGVLIQSSLVFQNLTRMRFGNILKCKWIKLEFMFGLWKPHLGMQGLFGQVTRLFPAKLHVKHIFFSSKLWIL